MKFFLNNIGFSLFIFLSPSIAFSFVELVTHGYPACISCHVSPSGGGLLTDYGRSLSKDLVSTWSPGDAFTQPFFGAVKNTEKIKWGGDIRTIQTYLDNNNINRGELFSMQQNIEVGVSQNSVTFVATAGLKQGPDRVPDQGTFLSERHYILWQTAPTSRLRVGKFRQAFGINTPNHTRFIKDFFGFGFLSETYNLEFTQFYETYEISVSSSLGRIDLPQDAATEKNISSSFTYYLNDNSRIGTSVLLGESQVERRSLIGLNAILPLSEHWLGLFELDYESAHLAIAPQHDIETIASLSKIGHQPFKGLMWYFLFEHKAVNSIAPYRLTHAPGVGVQWFPVPHLNIQLEYQRVVNSAPDSINTNSWSNPNNLGWLLFHIYL